MNLCLEEYLKRQQIGREINIEIAVSWNIPVQSRCGYLEVVKSRRHGSYIRHITSCQSIQDLFDVSAKASLISDWWFRFYIGEMILVIEIWRWFFMIWQVSNNVDSLVQDGSSFYLRCRFYRIYMVFTRKHLFQ